MKMTLIEHLFCAKKHEKVCGPAGWKWNNPAIGWVVQIGYKEISPLFKSRRAAQKWVEDQYIVKSWKVSSLTGFSYPQDDKITQEHIR